MATFTTILKPLTFYRVTVNVNSFAEITLTYGPQNILSLVGITPELPFTLNYFKTGLQNQSLTLAFTGAPATGSIVVEEIMVSPYEVDDYQQKNLSFSEKIKDPEISPWVGNYTLYPEYFCRINDQVVSMLNGAMWWHNQGPGYDNFFGQQYDTRVAKVLNSVVPVAKYIESISVEANLRPDYSHLQTEYSNPYGTPGSMVIQSTDLYATDFHFKNGVWYSTYFFDRLTPPVSTPQGYNNNLYTGDKMRGQYGFIFLQYITVNYNLVLNAANIGFIQAPGAQTMPSGT
jgi:hypothetical protein